MTKTLYIHIGSHKTGSTSIQASLAENPKILAAKNLTYYRENRVPLVPDFPDIHSWLGPVDGNSFLPQGFKALEAPRLSDTLASLGTDVVVSSENFSFFFDPKAIEELHDSLSRNFDNIKIICYLRRQDRHAISHKQEGSKPNRHPEYELWGNNINPLPPYRKELDLYLDYNHRMGMWADVFGESAINLRIYESNRLKNKNAVDDFFEILGLEPPRKAEWRNKSQSAMPIILGHIINSGRFPNKPFLREIMGKMKVPDTPWLAARSNAQNFYSNYENSNKLLNKRFSLSDINEDPFSSDFEDYPPISAISNPDLDAALRALLWEIEKLRK